MQPVTRNVLIARNVPTAVGCLKEPINRTAKQCMAFNQLLQVDS